MITRDMCRILGLTPEMTRLAMDWALEHDLPEVLTGDVPTPSKMVIKRHINYEAVVDDFASDSYAVIRRAVTGTPADEVVKLADIMEAILFLKTEGVRVDDPTTHTNRVFTGITQSYRKAVMSAIQKFPELPWHLLVDYREEIEESPVRQMVQPD